MKNKNNFFISKLCSIFVLQKEKNTMKNKKNISKRNVTLAILKEAKRLNREAALASGENLVTRVVKSKKDYSRKNFKIEVE